MADRLRSLVVSGAPTTTPTRGNGFTGENTVFRREIGDDGVLVCRLGPPDS